MANPKVDLQHIVEQKKTGADGKLSPRLATLEKYRKVIEIAQDNGELDLVMRELMLNDLFFLFLYGLNCSAFANNDWVYDRSREFESDRDGYLDLWPREHFKSSLITMAAVIQEILRDPEITIGIFSFNRPSAKMFLRSIKWQFENNDKLKELFPDVLYADPSKESPKWSLASDTPVLTTKGWTTHGALQVGDVVFGSDGKAIKVLGNSGPMHDIECFKVVFDDCSLVASGEHLWPVECKIGAEWNGSVIKTKMTSELKARSKRERMLSTPVIDGSQNLDLPVDPYVLGLWLGNGTAGTNIISFNNDYLAEGLEEISQAGYSYYIHRAKTEDNFSMYGIDGLKEKLEKLGCLRSKHVPSAYLKACPDDRRALLQGLMDSDGTCKKDGPSRCGGMCMFSNTNADLASSALFLATSLGMRPSIIDFMPKTRGKQRVYQVYFIGVKSNPPFRLHHKLSRCKDKRVKVARYVQRVERTESVVVNCIKVDAPDHLYLAGEYLVPTHNSEDDGIVCKRKGLPKEMTVEAWGLVDGMPTGRHWRLMVYDDMVTKDSVTSPEMITKVTDAVSLSFNLGSIFGDRRWMVGTRYHMADTYSALIKRGAAKLRIYSATENGEFDGPPVLWSRELLAKKIRDMGTYIASCQLFNNPVMEGEQTFDQGWVQYWNVREWDLMNRYILVDPANSKTKKSDYTVILVMGLGPDKNYYVIDGLRDKLSVKERSQRVMALHSMYRPIGVGYEKYGIQTDIDFLEEMQAQQQYRFNVTPLGGNMSKIDRIKRLQPLFESKRIYMPERMIRVDYQGKPYDFTQSFLQDEYLQFPYMTHDDMLDCMARITDEDMKAHFPSPVDIDRRTGLPMDSSSDEVYDYGTYAYN